jgi:alkanesulfonate monooxygenase SsuD/methylene tetrahydromethanopterin reductase-like flavin-dependent oxidoreductase (luciferase family)
MTVEFGLALPAGPPKGQLDRWLRDLDIVLPQIGKDFSSLWMTDHFFWEDQPTFEAWTALAYVAARWPQFKLGPAVLGQSYRNPALMAKMGATLQTLSGGRLIMAVGAGWKEDEYHAYGYEYPRPGIRVGQLEDTLEIIKRLWTEPGKISYQGQYYSITDAYCEPKPDPIPPMIVGGGGSKTMMLAARYGDGWNIPDANFEYYRERAAVLRQHCEAIRRDPASIQMSWFGRLAVGKTEAEALALSDGKWNPTNAFTGTPQQVIELMSPFVELGVELFMVEILGLPDPYVIHTVLDEILPHLRQ